MSKFSISNLDLYYDNGAFHVKLQEKCCWTGKIFTET